jgi:hypothetical protein
MCPLNYGIIMPNDCLYLLRKYAHTHTCKDRHLCATATVIDAISKW